MGPPAAPIFDSQLFRDAFQTSPIGIAVESLDGQLLFVNPAFCRFLGFTEEELRTKHCVDFSPREDAEKDWALFQQLRAGSIDHYQLEKRYFRRDGSLAWGSLAISLLNSRPSPLVIAMVEDITEKKAAEEAQFRYAAIVESSEDAIISKTLDGIITSWNTSAQRIYGYTEAEAIGTSISIIVPPERLDEQKNVLERLRAGQRITPFDTVRLTKEGKRIDVCLTLSPIRDSSGAIVGSSGIARDISERRRQQQTLRASEERLRLAQRAAHIGGFERDVQTGIVTWATEVDSMYGLAPGTLMGTNVDFFQGLIHPDDREKVTMLSNEAVKSGEPMNAEWRVVWGDGSIHWIAGSWQVLANENGEPSRMIGVNLDITNSKHAEEAMQAMNRDLQEKNALLQAREELLRVFVKNAPVAVAMLDRDMRYMQVSDRWCSENSVQASELLGRLREELPEMPERWKEVNRRALQGETLRADEDRWESAGITRWARWEVRPWRNPDGTVGGILVFAEDITQRKQMEDDLSGMSRKLIQSQEQERTRIGRELHDDINQRLAMLAVELEQLKENPSEVESRVEELRKRTTEISNDVQALSHDLHSSKLEYLGVIQGMKSWCKEFAERREMDINFRSDVESVLPLDLGLPLFRVLQEALTNAFKHSGVKRIEVQLHEEAGEILLTIRDFGNGFDIEAARQGRGLGLTSMRERIRLVNGTIDIQSKPMAGTTIHARVPFTSEHVPRGLAV